MFKKTRIIIVVLGLFCILSPVMAVNAQTRDAIVITNFDSVKQTNVEYPVEIEIRYGECEAPEIWFEIDHWVEDYHLTENNIGYSDKLTYAPAEVVDEELGVYSATFYLEYLPTGNYIPGNTYAASAQIGIGCYGQEPTFLGYYLVGQLVAPHQIFLPIIIN
jgi:hypothetical protein